MMIVTRHYPNHHLPGQGSRAVTIQHHLPVMPTVREHYVCPHTHPSGILTDVHRVAMVGYAGLGMLQVSIPQENYIDNEGYDWLL